MRSGTYIESVPRGPFFQYVQYKIEKKIVRCGTYISSVQRGPYFQYKTEIDLNCHFQRTNLVAFGREDPADPYLMTFYSVIVIIVIDGLTRKYFPSEASIMVARQLKIVSQVDALTISAARNIQYVFKMLLCLKVFVKDVFDMYLNKRHHIVFSLYLVRQGLGEH